MFVPIFRLVHYQTVSVHARGRTLASRRKHPEKKKPIRISTTGKSTYVCLRAHRHGEGATIKFLAEKICRLLTENPAYVRRYVHSETPKSNSKSDGPTVKRQGKNKKKKWPNLRLTQLNIDPRERTFPPIVTRRTQPGAVSRHQIGQSG